MTNEVIPIFDTLTHPTVAGTWLEKNCGNTFSNLAEELDQADFKGACAVGLDGQDCYDHKTFADACRNYPQLIPIAGYSPKIPQLNSGGVASTPERATRRLCSTDPKKNLADEVLQSPDKKNNTIAKDICVLKELGYKGIKIHPRFSALSLEKDIELFVEIFNAAGHHGLTVFLCTYSHFSVEKYPETDPLYSIVKLIKNTPETKVVLLHGGDVNLLRYSEFVRFTENVLLDLSFTINRYEASSLDLDIAYLFRTLDRKLCIGSDYPEYSPLQLRARFKFFSRNLEIEKKENIAYRNIVRLLNE